MNSDCNYDAEQRMIKMKHYAIDTFLLLLSKLSVTFHLSNILHCVLVNPVNQPDRRTDPHFLRQFPD